VQLLDGELKLLAATSIKNNNFLNSFYVSLFSGLEKAGLLEAASHIMCLSTVDNGNQQWVASHADQVKAFKTWMENWICPRN
jgi:hypothetical protein